MARLSEKEIQTIVRGVKFQCGWSIEATTFHGELQITVWRPQRDADQPQKNTAAPAESNLCGPLPETRDDLLRLIVAALQFVQLHEIAEWLRFNGNRVLSPHGQVSMLPDDQYDTETLSDLLARDCAVLP